MDWAFQGFLWTYIVHAHVFHFLWLYDAITEYVKLEKNYNKTRNTNKTCPEIEDQ